MLCQRTPSRLPAFAPLCPAPCPLPRPPLHHHRDCPALGAGRRPAGSAGVRLVHGGAAVLARQAQVLQLAQVGRRDHPAAERAAPGLAPGPPPTGIARAHGRRHAALAAPGPPWRAPPAVRAVLRRAADRLGLQLGSGLSHRLVRPVAAARLRARQPGPGRGHQALAHADGLHPGGPGGPAHRRRAQAPGDRPRRAAAPHVARQRALPPFHPIVCECHKD